MKTMICKILGWTLGCATLLAAAAPALAQWDDGNEPPGRRAATDFDMLMKSASDLATPLPGPLEAQFQVFREFRNLPPALQDKAVPELLGLLRNETPLAGEENRTGAVFQVRHRANLALAQIAGVCFGQFPALAADEPLTDEQRAANAKAAADLVARWRQWWQQARPRDAAGRKALAAPLRKPLLDTNVEGLFRVNCSLCIEDEDVSPLPQLAKRLLAVDPRDNRKLSQALAVYCRLARLPQAPPDAAQPMLDYIKKYNRPELCKDQNVFQGVQQVCWQLVSLTSTGQWSVVQKELVETDDKGERLTRKVTVLSDALVKEWEDAIRDRVEEAEYEAEWEHFRNAGEDEAAPAGSAAPAPAGR